MASVRLTFPQHSVMEDGTKDEPLDSPHNFLRPVLPAPEVELQLSSMERQQDRIQSRLQPERVRQTLDHREKWRAGVYNELLYWDGYLRDRGGQFREDFLDRTDPSLPLQAELVELITLPKSSVLKILDVGAGPLTWLGKTNADWTIKITAIDPLAAAYDQLLAAYQIVPLVRTRNVAAEELLHAFRPGTFNLIVARNSLDHALDPVGAIQQMLELVKRGGALFLAHAANEAAINGFKGLNQWNLRLEGTDLIFEDSVCLTNINALLRERATVSNALLRDRWLQTTIRPR